MHSLGLRPAFRVYTGIVPPRGTDSRGEHVCKKKNKHISPIIFSLRRPEQSVYTWYSNFAIRNLDADCPGACHSLDASTQSNLPITLTLEFSGTCFKSRRSVTEMTRVSNIFKVELEFLLLVYISMSLWWLRRVSEENFGDRAQYYSDDLVSFRAKRLVTRTVAHPCTNHHLGVKLTFDQSQTQPRIPRGQPCDEHREAIRPFPTGVFSCTQNET